MLRKEITGAHSSSHFLISLQDLAGAHVNLTMSSGLFFSSVWTVCISQHLDNQGKQLAGQPGGIKLILSQPSIVLASVSN